ncbi:hypothetical protein FBZ87_1093 [Nitrospirillum amazonense]|uniref:DoxX-like protein n=1 Tax=Nitrospirillum amazonense TaxID=28077 RepID=A0A560JD90_9PROT|nr:hypothetical protein FBZ87_1093 [Nitrospirillum amazonense]
MTGALEIVIAALIALPDLRRAGLILGLIVIVAAVVTTVRHREFSHLVPLGLFVALLLMAVRTV